jgi:outer membrane protein OmpA-like peptidoglycan-associated protein
MRSVPTQVAHRTLVGRPSTLIGCLLVLLAGPAAAGAQTLESQLEATAARYAEARAQHLNLISPRNFGRAADQLARAQQDHRQGGRIEEIRKKLLESNQALDRAEELQEIGELLMRETLAARERALAANAPDFAAERWAAAEKKAQDAGRKVEDGNQNDARRRASEAEALYGEAELQAVRNSVLGEARHLREEALAARADERAARTFAEADTLLRRADASLGVDPGQPSEAGELAKRAADGYAHSTWVAVLSDSVRRREVTTEAVVRRHEAELIGIAEALGLQAGFAQGSGPVAADVLAAILSLLEDRRRLETSLADREEEIRRLQASSDSLGDELARLGEREATVSAELRERERREQTLREVQALFDEEEAEIILGVEQLTIRLLGLTFDSGSHKIRPEDYSLLTKVQQAIRAFSESRITVEGHTDSQGNDEFNQALSARRAIAVREYILANMAISADRIRAVGYGESRPISRNDTAAGRAQNRRIDVVLELIGAS